VSQILNKSLKEQKAAKSVRDNNPDGMKQAACKRCVSASLRERYIVVHHCILRRMESNKCCKLRNAAKN